MKIIKVRVDEWTYNMFKEECSKRKISMNKQLLNHVKRIIINEIKKKTLKDNLASIMNTKNRMEELQATQIIGNGNVNKHNGND